MNHPVRLLCESTNPLRNIADATTSARPFWWRGSSVSLSIALASAGAFLTSADIGTIIIEVKAANATESDANLIRITAGADDCDPDFTADDWAAGTGALLTTIIPYDDAALAAGSYQIIVRHEALDGSRDTYLRTTIDVHDDASESESIATPPIPPVEYYTKPESDARYGGPGVLATTSGPQTFSGAQTFSGQVEGTGQTAAAGSSFMNRDLVAAMFAMSPRVHQFMPFTSGTVTGSGSSVGNGFSGTTIINIGNTADASARVKLTENFGFGDANAGYTFGFAMPFIIRVPLAFSNLDATGSFVVRVYACTQGTMTLPPAGSHPYPANTRGLCAELRQKSTGVGWEARLCTRDGTAAAAGTPAESAWFEIAAGNMTKHVDVVMSNDAQGTAKMFIACFTPSLGEYPPSSHTTPLATVTGTGVPSTNAAVATFWTRPEVAIVGNGVATPGGSRYFVIYPCTAVYGSSH